MRCPPFNNNQIREHSNLETNQPRCSHLPLRVESKKAMVQPCSKVTNLPQPNKGPENCQKRHKKEQCKEIQQKGIHLLEYPIPLSSSVTKSRVRRSGSACSLFRQERLNSNSRVAFDHQIVIIIIKSKKSQKNYKQN